MAILIKELALPNNCHMCFMGFGGFCAVCPAEEDGICPPQGRPSWCPLIEVPQKHGDLIDRDQLLYGTSRAICGRDGAVVGIQNYVFDDDILNAPVIIGKEGE